MNDAAQSTAPASRSNLKAIAIGFSLLLLLAGGAVVTLVWMMDDLVSDRIVAERVAAHVGLFSDVMASDVNYNLRDRRKAEALSRRSP